MRIAKHLLMFFSMSCLLYSTLGGALNSSKADFLEKIGFWFEDVGYNESKGYFVKVGTPYITPRFRKLGSVGDWQKTKPHETIQIPQDDGIVMINDGRGPDSITFSIFQDFLKIVYESCNCFGVSERRAYFMNAEGGVFNEMWEKIFTVSNGDIAIVNKRNHRKLGSRTSIDDDVVAQRYKSLAESHLSEASKSLAVLRSQGKIHDGFGVVCYSNYNGLNERDLVRMTGGRELTDNLRKTLSIGKQCGMGGCLKNAVYIAEKGKLKITGISIFFRGEQKDFYSFDAEGCVDWALISRPLEKTEQIFRYEKGGECAEFVQLKNNKIVRTYRRVDHKKQGNEDFSAIVIEARLKFKDFDKHENMIYGVVR